MIGKWVCMCTLSEEALPWKSCPHLTFLFHFWITVAATPLFVWTMLSKSVEDLRSPFIHAKPIHTKINPSPLSTESGSQNYRGFFNLAMLFLGANMIRLVIENFSKYGILLSLPGTGVPLSDLPWLFIILGMLSAHLTVVYVIEKSTGHFGTLGIIGITVILVNIASLLLIPPYIIWTHMYHPCISGAVLFIGLVFSMKIISYHVVNAELRRFYLEAKKKDADGQDPYPACTYPNNISAKNFLYFLAAPTLCYQPSYPRIPRIRRSFLFKRLFEFASSMTMSYFIIEQFARPTVVNSMKHLEENNIIGILERMLKLSPSSLYVWLLGFYGVFHSFFNAVAELLRFGDRQFYQDWWNARSLDEYWRLWNAPVHQWLKRHIYIPMRAKGYGPIQAQIVIFAISAFFHEYLVSIPTHSVQGWAFILMVSQVPMIILSKWFISKYPNSSAGNFFFWITLCIFGQPMCVLMYYRAWIKNNSP